jgi:ATP-dependent Clp protease ATP-binding subunit ClpA
MTAGMQRFNQAARDALSLAHQEAVSLRHAHIMPGHILLGLVQDEGPVGRMLVEQGANLGDLRRIVSENIPPAEKAAQTGSLDLHLTTQNLLELAIAETRRKQQNVIGAEHLLLALLQLDDARTAAVFQAAGLDPGSIRERIPTPKLPLEGEIRLDELLDTLWACRRLFEADPARLQHLEQIDAILREHFRG